MACCLLANLFIGGIWRRSPEEISRMGGAGSRSSSLVRALLGPHWRIWIALLAGSEILLAVLLGLLLATLLGDPGAHAGHAAAGSAAASQLLLVLALAAVAGCAVVQVREPSRQVVLGTVVVGMGLAITAAVVPGGWALHATWMALFMLTAVALPSVIGPYLRRTRVGPPVTVATVRIAAPLIATAAALLMVVSHLPVVHAWLMADAVGRVAVCVGALLLGVPLWSMLLGDDRRELRTARVGALIAFAAPAGILGLVLILAPVPLWPSMVDGALLPAIWDQRLGGALMMAADLVFVVPLLSSAIATGTRTAIAVGRTA